MMTEQLRNETNDGLECFNFKLFLDDINSSSHKKKSIFMSPQQTTVKKHKIPDAQYNISRNLGSDFKRANQGIKDFENFNLFSSSKPKNTKNRTPDTNYTTQSTKGFHSKGKPHNTKMFNIWGDYKLSRADDEEKRSTKNSQKKNLMQELGSGSLVNSTLVPEKSNEFSLFKDCSRSYVGAPNNPNSLSELFHPKIGNKTQEQINNQQQQPFLFNDIFSVSSNENNSAAKPPKKLKKGRGTLAKFSESFEPFPMFGKRPIKKNSFSACKVSDFHHNYRKGSYNEREYRRRNYVNYNNFEFGSMPVNQVPTKVKLLDYVTSDVDFLVKNLKKMAEKAINERRKVEFPLIGKNH